MNKDKLHRAGLQLFGISFFVGSLYLLFTVDWRIALGAFLLQWSMNLDRKLNG